MSDGPADPAAKWNVTRALNVQIGDVRVNKRTREQTDKDKVERGYDEALEGTFPASDPPQNGPRPPTGDPRQFPAITAALD